MKKDDIRKNGNGFYSLKLYVSGAAPNSLKAVKNIREICKKYFPGQYVLQIIDIYSKPHLARSQNIIAIPTLIKVAPNPLRIFIGNLSAMEQVAKHIQSAG
jgi:circadian clock protein KaiB